MSTLRVSTIQDTAGSNSSTPAAIANGICKAWVNFNGTFATSPFTTANGGIRAAFNVSSVTDNGTGDYTVNFSTALADTNYTVCCTQADGTTAGPIPFLLGFNPGGYGKTISITTTGIRVYSITSGGGVYDAIYNYVAIFR
jgi:hypothetical protein